MTDPRVAIRELLESHWSIDVKPLITADWYEASAKKPQITVSHLYTRLEPTGLSDSPGSAARRLKAVYAVDVWSLSQEQRRRMLLEADRIIHGHCLDVDGLEYADDTEWRDLDEPGPPRLYRSSLRVEVLSYG